MSYHICLIYIKGGLMTSWSLHWSSQQIHFLSQNFWQILCPAIHLNLFIKCKSLKKLITKNLLWLQYQKTNQKNKQCSYQTADILIYTINVYVGYSVVVHYFFYFISNLKVVLRKASMTIFGSLWQLQQKTIMSILNTAALEGHEEVRLLITNSYITLGWTTWYIDRLSICPESTVVCSCGWQSLFCTKQ